MMKHTLEKGKREREREMGDKFDNTLNKNFLIAIIGFIFL
jgi:hypothetical protein